MILTLAIVVFIITVIYSRMAVYVVHKIESGFVFAKFTANNKTTSGWIKRNQYYACVNGRKSDCDMISIHKGDCEEVIMYGNIQQVKEIRGITAIVIGNLL